MASVAEELRSSLVGRFLVEDHSCQDISFMQGKGRARSHSKMTHASVRQVCSMFVILTKHLRNFAHKEKRFTLAFSRRGLTHDSSALLFWICDKAAPSTGQACLAVQNCCLYKLRHQVERLNRTRCPNSNWGHDPQ